jgi:hypothetical protein
MPAFAGQLAPRDLAAIALYLADRAHAEPIPSKSIQSVPIQGAPARPRPNPPVRR